jgi:hypothetical protein
MLVVKRDTPCTSILLLALVVVKRIHPARPYYCQWKGYMLHVHTAGDGKGYTLTSILLVLVKGYPVHV